MTGRWKMRKRIGWSGASAMAVVALAVGVDTGDAVAQGLADYDYANLGLRGVAGEIFFVDPSDVEATVGFGGRLDMGFLGPHVRTQLRIAFWDSELAQSEITRFETRIADLVESQNGVRPTIDLGVIDRDAVIIGGDFHWMPTPENRIRPYLGFGTELYILSGSGEAIDDTFVDDALDLLTAGISAVGGLEFDLGSIFTVYGEARGSLAADIRSVSITGGIALIRK